MRRKARQAGGSSYSEVVRYRTPLDLGTPHDAVERHATRLPLPVDGE